MMPWVDNSDFGKKQPLDRMDEAEDALFAIMMARATCTLPSTSPYVSAAMSDTINLVAKLFYNGHCLMEGKCYPHLMDNLVRLLFRLDKDEKIPEWLSMEIFLCIPQISIEGDKVTPNGISIWLLSYVMVLQDADFFAKHLGLNLSEPEETSQACYHGNVSLKEVRSFHSKWTQGFDPDLYKVVKDPRILKITEEKKDKGEIVVNAEGYLLSRLSFQGSDNNVAKLKNLKGMPPKLWGALHRHLLAMNQQVIRTMHKDLVALPLWKNSALLRDFREIAHAHNLTETEEFITAMLYAWENLGNFLTYPFSKDRDGKQSVSSTLAERHPRKVHEMVGVLLGDGTISSRARIYLHNTRGTLAKKGILLCDMESKRSIGEISPSLIEYLTDVNPDKKPYISTTSEPLNVEDALDIKTFDLKEVELEVLDSCCRRGTQSVKGTGRGTHILIHGHPGTGKTEMAKSLAHRHGKILRSILTSTRDGMVDSIPADSRFSALSVTALNITENDIVLVDEADRILNGGAETGYRMRDDLVYKDAINDFMDTAKGTYIWVSNEVWDVARSVMRRFDYVLEMKVPNRSARKKIVGSVSKRKGFPEAPCQIQEIVDKLPLTPAGMGKLFDLYKEEKGEVSTKVLEEVARSHLDATSHGWKEDNTKSAEQYDPSYLNVVESTLSVSETLEQIKVFYDMPEERKKALGIKNFNILLYGPPGTGKTEWARYISKELGKPFLEVLAASLLGKYVGESETNIREKFEDAEKEGAVLLVDEADALLQSRETAEKSWEISTTEQFMYSMENFKGVLICTTNFQDSLDKAVHRRFTVGMHFGYLTKENVRRMLDKALQLLNLPEVTHEEWTNLSKGQYTPSDFGSATKRFALVPESRMTKQMYLDHLSEASRAREGKRRLGF